MSADKRTVTTDALETLGMIISDKEKRDAIHLAVDNAVAAHTLRPGEDVGFLPDGTAGTCEKPLGIVDPFLKNAVKKGERFWLVVYPRKITSLRHVWEHPDFQMAEDNPIKPTDKKAASEQWLRDFVKTADCPGYETLIAAAANNDDSEYLHFSGSDAHGKIPPEFWDHVETVTGRSIGKENRADYFSCSC